LDGGAHTQNDLLPAIVFGLRREEHSLLESMGRVCDARLFQEEKETQKNAFPIHWVTSDKTLKPNQQFEGCS